MPLTSSSNPCLIQQGDPTRTPLFLIHDAGGSVAAYSKLLQLNRPVYTISDSRAQESYRDVESQARSYIDLVKKVVSKGEILLGGFSYGSVLALTLAQQINSAQQTSGPRSRSRSRLRVTGLVLLDAVYPIFPDLNASPGGYAGVSIDLVLRNCPAKERENVLRTMKWSARNARVWASSNMRKTMGSNEQNETDEPPPAVLVLASDAVPVKGDDSSQKKIAMVDQFRNERSAGWNQFVHGDDFIAAIYTVSTHHFGFWEQPAIVELSATVGKACELLAED